MMWYQMEFLTSSKTGYSWGMAMNHPEIQVGEHAGGDMG